MLFGLTVKTHGCKGTYYAIENLPYDHTEENYEDARINQSHQTERSGSRLDVGEDSSIPAGRLYVTDTRILHR